ncbi:MAG: glycogen-binding domain-containing protein [Longimicrobiales bacterium]
MRAVRTGARLLLVAGVIVPSPALAQTHALEVEAAASHARPPSDRFGDPGNYLVGGLRWLRRAEQTYWFAGASGGAAVAGERGGWIAANIGTQLHRNLSEELAARLTLSAAGFRIGAPDAYRAALLRVEPELRATVDRVSVAFRMNGGLGRVHVPGLDAESLRSIGATLDGRVSVGPAVLEVGGAVSEAARGQYLRAGAALGAPVGRARVRFELGVWSLPGSQTELTGGIRIDVPLRAALGATASLGRSDPDPLLGTLPGDFATVGVVWSVLESVSRQPPVVELLTDERVRFTVRREGSASVAVLGDFSRWEPIPMTHDGQGRWSAVVAIEPGVHHFGFRADGEWWVPAEAPGRTEDEWGFATATLVVPDA